MIRILTKHGGQIVSSHSKTHLAKLSMNSWPNVVTHVKSDYMVFPQQCGGFSLKFVLAGCESYHFPNHRLQLNPIHFLTTGRGKTYSSTIDSFETVEAVCIFFEKHTYENILQELFRRHGDRATVTSQINLQTESLQPVDWNLYCFIQDMISAPPQGELFETELRRILIYVHERMLQRASKWRMLTTMGEKTRNDLIARVLKGKGFLDSNLSQPIVLEDAAEQANLSKYHFIRTFKQILGSSPMAYLRYQRLRFARYLLRTTQKSITDIAAESGYRNLCAFTRAFSERHQISPSKFRLHQGAHPIL